VLRFRRGFKIYEKPQHGPPLNQKILRTQSHRRLPSISGKMLTMDLNPLVCKDPHTASSECYAVVKREALSFFALLAE
jgi:hypothetical protein